MPGRVMHGTIKGTPLEVARKLKLHIEAIVPAFVHAVAVEWARAALAEAVLISPFDQGMYRASHRVSLNRPFGANLSPAPSYGIPGDFEADLALRQFKVGDTVWLCNDAGRYWKRMATRYVYAVNVESKGWGSTPPYRVYEQVLRRLKANERELTKRAARRVKRLGQRVV